MFDLSLLSTSLTKGCLDYIITMSGEEQVNIRWSREETIQLIDLYRQHQCLWEVKNDKYKNRNKRMAALMAIAKDLRKT